MELLTLLITILIPICTALAFVAYKHPIVYAKYNEPILIIFSIIYVGYMGWMLGYQQGFYNLDNLDNYEDGLPISSGYSILIFFSLLIYLNILSRLPKILSSNNHSEKN